MRILANTILYASFFIALCAGALAAETVLLLGKALPWKLLGFITAATLFIYNSHALFMVGSQSGLSPSPRQVWVRRNQTWLAVVSAVALAATVLLLDRFDTQYLLWLGHLAVLAVAYTLPFVPVRGRWLALRSVPLVKVFLIAYVWAAVTVQLPAMAAGFSLSDKVVQQLMLERLIYIFALAVLFDIRDVFRDRTNQTVTLPGLLGQPVAKLLSILLLLVFCVLVWWWHPTVLAVPLIASALGAILVVASAHAGRSDNFFSGWADGMMLLQAILVAGAVFLG